MAAQRSVLASGMTLVGIGAAGGVIASHFTAPLPTVAAVWRKCDDVRLKQRCLRALPRSVSWPMIFARVPGGSHERAALRMIIET